MVKNSFHCEFMVYWKRCFKENSENKGEIKVQSHLHINLQKPLTGEKEENNIIPQEKKKKCLNCAAWHL